MQRAGLDTGRVVPQLPQATATYTTFAAQCGRVSFHAAAALLILSLVGCAQPLRTATRITVGCSMVAHAADVSTTMWAAGAGVGHELNPLLAPHIDNPIAFAAVKFTPAVIGNYVLLRGAETHPKLTLALGIGQCVGFSAIAAHNASVIRKATR